MAASNSQLDRRTFLHGVGVTMALPWLESIPVWGGEPTIGTAPGTFPKRFAALFMGNGINMDHWWARGTGADMELGKSLEPMAPLKTKMNFITGLFNKNATHVGIHPGQTGNILSGASLQNAGAVVMNTTGTLFTTSGGTTTRSGWPTSLSGWVSASDCRRNSSTLSAGAPWCTTSARWRCRIPFSSSRGR